VSGIHHRRTGDRMERSFRAVLIIEHVDTANMVDGQPLPPFIDNDGGIWSVVGRLPDARTRWRRIRLSLEVRDRPPLRSRWISSFGGESHDKRAT